MTYKNSPGFAAGSATSKNAAATLYDRDGIQFGIMTALYAVPTGLNVDDARRVVETARRRDFDRSTIAARFTELEAAGMVAATDKTSPSRRGKPSTVYKLTIKGRDYVLNN